MGFVKVVKNKAYFKRFQVKYRRRREGKTDYQARSRLITQDKNKYNSPKYRIIVRFTNKDVICQIAYAKLAGDVVMSAAYSHELNRYGVMVGHTNYAASYATGLLLARRHLTKLGLASRYVGKENPDGEDYTVEPTEEGPRPFLAHLDIGLARTTTGSRIFGVLKGALDGGINIPHNEKRFYGYSKEDGKVDAKKLRSAIFGGHVSSYMKELATDDPKRYKQQFGRYIKNSITHDKVEGMWKKAHQSIRATPQAVKTEKHPPKAGEKHKHYNQRKLTLAERKSRVHQKLANMKKHKKAPSSSSAVTATST